LAEPVTISRLGFRDNRIPIDQAARAGSMRQARDGSMLWWGGTDTPLPGVVPPRIPTTVKVAVSPVRPGHTVTVEYRVNGGPICQAIGLSEPRVRDEKARVFRAILPGQSGGLVEFLPVLRIAGQPISPRLGESVECSRYHVRCGAAPVEAAESAATPSAELAGGPRWDWNTSFLGTFTIAIREELVGTLADGIRVNWHFTEGRFVGPDLEGAFLPGSTDWMRIRPDGVAMVEVMGCLQTPTGARVHYSNRGILELGADGYTRALRGEFDPLPPFVGTPTFATADKKLEWLNRAQCLAVGKVDMKALVVAYDVYLVQVGGRKYFR